MHRKGCFILCLLLTNLVAILGHESAAHSSRSYIKEGKSYQKLREYELQKPVIQQGYVELASNLLYDFKQSKVSAEVLNKFSIGLEQYFALKLYEKFDNDDIEKLNTDQTLSAYDLTNILDPVSLPDVGYDEIPFFKAQVFGYPLYKHKLDPVYNQFASPYEYSTSLASKSDVVIFNGYFNVKNVSYYFVYDLKSASFQANVHRLRGYQKPLSVKIALNFENEDLIHTYDSSYENYQQTNELICQKLKLALEDVYLPYLDKLKFKEVVIQTAHKDVKYISMYRKLILSALLESAIHYIDAKGLASFEVNPLNFTTNPTGKKLFTQTYTQIKLQGLLNFNKQELINSTIDILEDGTEAKLSEAIELYYPQDGEKETFIEFIYGEGKHAIPKKYKIKSIQVIAVYNALLNERPVKVRRNKEVFNNMSGFLIKFDIDNYDPIYEFLFRHVGNDISRAIERELVAQGA